MEEEEIVPPGGPSQLSTQEQLQQYGLMAGYFVAVYLVCWLLCRLVPWQRLGRGAALVQGGVLLVVVSGLYWLWALPFTRLEDEYDIVKAFGIGFITLLVAIGGCAHGEWGRNRALRRGAHKNGGEVVEPEQLDPGTENSEA